MTRPFDVTKIFTSLKSIFPYLGITFCVVLGTVIFGTLLSVLVVRQKFCSKKIWRRFADSYIHILRCTPSLILLFIVFYGIPKFVFVLFGININFFPRIIFVIIALSLLYSAQMAEIIRSALLAVGREQYEAGLCVGLSRWQSMFRIIVPQAFVIVIPNLGNSLIDRCYGGWKSHNFTKLRRICARNLHCSGNHLLVADFADRKSVQVARKTLFKGAFSCLMHRF